MEGSRSSVETGRPYKRRGMQDSCTKVNKSCIAITLLPLQLQHTLSAAGCFAPRTGIAISVTYRLYSLAACAANNNNLGDHSINAKRFLLDP